MIHWDMQDGVTGVALMVLGVDALAHNLPLAFIGILFGGYNFYNSFIPTDPDGV